MKGRVANPSLRIQRPVDDPGDTLAHQRFPEIESHLPSSKIRFTERAARVFALERRATAGFAGSVG
jgi:hypothetical protein